jgi:hypothetical protein
MQIYKNCNGASYYLYVIIQKEKLWVSAEHMFMKINECTKFQNEMASDTQTGYGGELRLIINLFPQKMNTQEFKMAKQYPFIHYTTGI